MNNMKFGGASKDWSHLNSGLGFLAGRLAGSSKGKGGDGLSARDRAALMDREHAQSIEKMAFGHTFGEKAAGSASRRQSAADRRKHKQGKEMVSHTEGEKRTSVTHGETEKRTTAAAAAQHAKDDASHKFGLLGSADTAKFGSMNLTSGSATFREPPKGNSHPQQKGNQFSGVGSDSSNQPATPLDHLG